MRTTLATRRAPISSPHPVVLQGSDRVMVLAPHPDDESLPVGGLLRRAANLGSEVRVIYATDGDNNPWAQRAVERRWRLGAEDRARWARRRRGEARNALGSLGIPADAAVFLALPDQGLTGLLLAGDPGPVRSLAGQIEEWRPTILLSPGPQDLHPDHNALAVMGRIALSGLPPALRPETIVEYVVHSFASGGSGEIRRLDLTPEESESKRRAILCHVSQLALRRRFMTGFARPVEDYAIDPGPADEAPGHPVRGARWDGETLILEVAPSRLGLGPVSILIAFGGSPRRSLTFDLPRRSGTVEVRDPALGFPVAAARCVRSRGGMEVALDLAGAAAGLGANGAFVKADRPAQRRLGLFDRAGWREIPAPAAQPRTLPREASEPASQPVLLGPSAP